MFSAKRAVVAVVAAAAFGVLGLTAPASADITINHYVATISNGTWSFKVHLSEQTDITEAFASLNNTSNKHVNGAILRTGPEYNEGYSWHLDSHDVNFVDISMEICDGSPQDVEDGTLSGNRYCPWGGRVVAMEQVTF
ncbi:BP74-related protein [Longispora urticae]